MPDERVVITDVQIPFGRVVQLVAQLWLATLPVALVAAAIGYAVGWELSQR